MSGHSKWSQIKRKKGKADAQRGRLFGKLIREIMVAARNGGNVDGNAPLRAAVQIAKDANMPTANIDRAIKKGTGELPGVNIEEVTYEGYGPAGVAILVEVLTDNRNRTTAEIRHLLGKNGGNLGETGCVGWMFDLKGVILVDKASCDEEKLVSVALEAGAEDVDDSSKEFFEVSTPPSALDKVVDAIKKMGVKITSSELINTPQTTVTLGEKESVQVLRLMELLEEHDDVQKVSANFDIPDEILQKLDQ